MLKFPFSDGQTYKKRPALVIKSFDDGDVVVSRITTAMHSTSFDVEISEWNQVGLLLPSVIRVHKLATLDMGLVERVLGKVGKDTRSLVKNKIFQLTA